MSKFNIAITSKEIFIHVGILRGETGMKTPDAIHVATAMAHDCEMFLINDKYIQTPQGLKKVLFSEH